MTTRLERIEGWLAERRRGRASPFLLGVTGAVAVGKSTLAGEIAAALAPQRVEIVGADGFLFSNAQLEARDLVSRKGFPESYDVAAMRAALAAIRSGPADFPGYSHTIYDVDPALTRTILPPDVLIVEGLGLERGAAAAGLDGLIYLEADEADVEAWFTDRFVDLWRAAEADPQSFYRRFRQMDEPRARAFAGEIWRAINLPNLRHHISGARALADLVIRKGPAHEILAVIPRGGD